MLDIYYASSTDQGPDVHPGRRVNDRSIDRSLGVWSNNVNAAVAVGIASTDDAVYFAGRTRGRGPRPASPRTSTFSSLKLDGDTAASEAKTDSHWPLLVAGVALGLGVGMTMLWALSRRQPQPAGIRV